LVKEGLCFDACEIPRHQDDRDKGLPDCDARAGASTWWCIFDPAATGINRHCDCWLLCFEALCLYSLSRLISQPMRVVGDQNLRRPTWP